MNVSICITTYNHEKYIAQAIESVLMQRTNFDYEIIIGEDDSCDNTRQIVKEYKSKYPNKIGLFLNDRKNVIYINGQPTGRWNFVNNLKNARGKYIALLDGDDYWTDSHKLQRQVDFLDSHPDFAMCFHNVRVVYEDSPQSSHPFYTKSPCCPLEQRTPQPISKLEDLLKGNFIQTPAVMFRGKLFGDFPDWFYTTDRGDWPLHVLNAQYGDIYYIDEVMAAYRVSKAGVYSSMSRADQLKGAMHAADMINRHMNYRYNNIIGKANARRLTQIIRNLEEKGDWSQSRSYALRYLIQYGFFDRKSFKVLGSIMKGIAHGYVTGKKRPYKE